MKEPAVWLYRQLTTRHRRAVYARLQAESQLPVSIIFYHRVADSHPNPWTIGRRDFVRQLDWLTSNFDIVSLAEAQRRIRAGGCDRPTVAITFDDGYAENAQFAIPELVRRRLTATYFVATHFVRSGSAFPHDIAAGKPLAPNTIDELKAFQDCGIEIGAHTRKHVDLGGLTQRELREEIVGSLDDLEQWLGRKPSYFAAPFGLPENLSQAAVDLFTELKLAGFCSAYGAFNWPNPLGFHLRRIHADPGLQRLMNWLTLDLRKLDDRRRLPFAEAPAQPPEWLSGLPSFGNFALPT